MGDRLDILEPWPGPWAAWAANFCRNNLWRVQNVLGDFDDMMSEAALAYLELRLRYGQSVNSPKHFMKLYQMYFSCWIHTLSVKDFHNREALFNIGREEKDFLMKSGFKERAGDPTLNLTILLNQGSAELKEVLNIFFNAPNEIMELLRRDASSYSPKQFWNRVLTHLSIPQEKSVALQKELIALLS